MPEVPSVRATLVALSCGHTVWASPDHELGRIIECSACPPQVVNYGDGTVPQRKWAVVHLLTTDVPAIVELAD